MPQVGADRSRPDQVAAQRARFEAAMDDDFNTPQALGVLFDLAPHDVAVVPGWTTYTLAGVDEAVVFSYSDRAAQEKLGFFREQRL